MIVLFGPILLLLGQVVACLGGAEPIATPTQPLGTPTASEQGVQRTAQTASYEIELEIGLVVTMLTSEEGQTTMGQMTGMTFTDQGQPVNHHLEVHIFDKGSGARVTNVVPTVRITDESDGTSREVATNAHPSGNIPYVLACKTTKHRAAERHLGDNLYLSDGEYTVTIGVDNETAVLESIAVNTAG